MRAVVTSRARTAFSPGTIFTLKQTRNYFVVNDQKSFFFKKKTSKIVDTTQPSGNVVDRTFWLISIFFFQRLNAEMFEKKKKIFLFLGTLC